VEEKASHAVTYNDDSTFTITKFKVIKIAAMRNKNKYAGSRK